MISLSSRNTFNRICSAAHSDMASNETLDHLPPLRLIYMSLPRLDACHKHPME